MPLSPSAARTHIHTRTIECNGYERDDGLWDIEGHLVDTKSYGFDSRWRTHIPAGEPIHEMWLRLTIDDRLKIHACEAATDYSPYPMCPDITGRFGELAGLSIGPGWMREVGKRVGGVLGCTHLYELLRPVATTAFQTLVKSERFKAPLEPGRRPPLLNSCHAHASDSEVVRERWPAFFTGPAAN